MLLMVELLMYLINMTKFFIAFILTAIAINMGIAGNWLYILPALFMVVDIVIWIVIKFEL